MGSELGGLVKKISLFHFSPLGRNLNPRDKGPFGAFVPAQFIPYSTLP
jgi:hypothetical protein